MRSSSTNYQLSFQKASNIDRLIAHRAIAQIVRMTQTSPTITRRTLLGSGLTAAAAPALPQSADTKETNMAATEAYWPNSARLAVSFSLMFEAGGQPISGAGGVIPDPIEKGLPDLPTNAFFQYGVYEGVPRILDLMDKHKVRLSSFMIGQAVGKAPDLAKEIVKRGHEAAAHGRAWQNSYFLDPDAERKFIADSVETIKSVTGQQPIGWNAYWMRNSPHTLDILHSLGFKYHIDEPSADQPFIVKLKAGDFVTVPYTLHMNDIVSYPFVGYNPSAYEQALRDEFDQLYEEGAHRRRMMVVSLHDRISGHANRVRVLDRFLAYAKSKPGVWFARKDEIARWALQHRSITPVYDRAAPTIGGLPGSAT
ncbi:polysaccharide deacetylase family protein [Bradyrhizobium sacchari]|nr:polysaccharide deacetylase family protein [Bradyrhizobium sacchari]